MKISKPLTWDDVARIYDDRKTSARHRPARTLPMEQVYDWAEAQDDIYQDPEETTLHLIEQEQTK